ncbi:metal-dependent hydrolase [Virgibacillus siamensis]|uniref:metal-dependent hydrolase n=1 Tax=Virgibacillus siamensis TaxID=480071 RepID=UPI000986D535|nr:metal-dependent hydrolase [Virgibacillus siamensis]
MTGKTHLIGGLTAGIAVQYFTDHYTQDLLFLASCTAGSLLPDICHGGSKIGRKLPILSNLVRLLFGHRTVTHSLLFMVILGAILSSTPVPASITAGIIIGVASHLLLDAATSRGIALLWPMSIKIRLPIYTHTGGLIEHVVMAMMIIAAGYIGYQMYIF